MTTGGFLILDTGVLRFLRPILSIDSDPSRICLFENVADRDFFVRASWKLHSFFRSTWIGDLLIALYGAAVMLSLRFPRGSDRTILAAAMYTNEQKELEWFSSCVPTFSVSPISFAKRDIFTADTLRFLLDAPWSVKRILRYLRFIRYLSRRYHFMALCNAAAAMSCYTRFCNELSRSRPAAVVALSLSLPQPQALLAASRALHIPRIYSSHAATGKLTKMLLPNADLILLPGSAQEIAYDPEKVKILYKGINGVTRPLHLPESSLQRLRLGIFLSAPVDETGLKDTIRSFLRFLKPARIVIRPHPILMLSPDLKMLLRDFSDVEVRTSDKLEDSIGRCDLIFSGNSSVHLEILRAGVASVYLCNLDRCEPDYYGFVANKIVFSPEDISVLSLPALHSFYDDSWVSRFKTYDASYLEDPQSVVRRLGSEISTFLLSRQQTS